MHAEITARVERIAADDRHGASWLAKEAVQAVVAAVELGEDPIAVARELVQAQPTIGAIAGALGRVLVAGQTPSSSSKRRTPSSARESAQRRRSPSSSPLRSRSASS